MRMRVIFLLFLLVTGVLSLPALAQFEPANQVDVEVTPAVLFVPRDQQFHFSYDIQSKPTSRQVIYRFKVTVGEEPGFTREGKFKMKGIISLLPPLNTRQWTGSKGDYSALNVPLVSWFPERGPSNDPAVFNVPANEAIQPGQKLSGFKVVARNLPGVRLFWVKGFVRPATEDEVLDFINMKRGTQFDNLDEIPDEFFDDIPRFRADHLDAVSGKIVGPDILPDGLSVDQLLDRLIPLKEQALQLGWIDNQGVANSLNKKLGHAKRRLAEGMRIPAINILHALIHELQAQRGKHVNENAFYLLKANTEFLIFKLESR